jgi:hypothetical protein
MLNYSEFAEIERFYRNVAQTEMEVAFDAGNSTTKFRFVDICAPLCDINDPLLKLMENSWLATIEYPYAAVCLLCFK